MSPDIRSPCEPHTRSPLSSGRGRPFPVHQFTVLAAMALLAGCSHPNSSLEQIRARGELRVVTLNAPTSYYLGAHGPQGFEYRLAAAFARDLGVTLVMKSVPNAAAMRAALSRGRVDLAAAQISPDEDWRDIGLTTTPYEEIPELVVQPRGRGQVHSITGLTNKRLVVLKDSPQQTLLETLRSGGMSELHWTALAADQADPMELINSGGADCAVLDASEFAFAQHLHPEFMVAFALPNPRPVQWVVPMGAEQLLQSANQFLAGARTLGELARIESDARNESGDFDYESAHQFQSDIAARLPALQGLFEEAAQASGLDWRLLAAVGYQESKWLGGAASADGARGIMMLTSDAATAVGVEDRADLRQNIVGGARYLAQVIDTIPKRIAEPDRTWLAAGRLQRRLWPPRGRTHPRAAGWPQRRPMAERPRIPAAAEPGALVHAHASRLCARLGTRPLRRERAVVPQHPRSGWDRSTGDCVGERRRPGTRAASRPRSALSAGKAPHRPPAGEGDRSRHRRAAKNSRSSVAHSSASTPAVTSSR